MKQKLARFALVSLALAILPVGPAIAQTDYPNKPVRVIVPFAPGGVVDLTARLLMQKLGDRLGKTFYVENVGGAGGNIGTRNVATATKDGYTLLVTSSSFVVNPTVHSNAGYDPQKDFSLITIAAASPNVFVVNPSQPINTLHELIDALKKDPTKYAYAHSGVGTLPHLSGELFRLTTKVDMVPVPFTGAGTALQAVVGGHAPVAVLAFPATVNYIKNGSLRGLAVTSDKRLAALPDLPTVSELGFPDLVAETLIFIAAPAGTPAAVTNHLSEELRNIIADADVRSKFDLYGFTPVATAPEESAKRVSQEFEKWKKVLVAAKLGKE